MRWNIVARGASVRIAILTALALYLAGDVARAKTVIEITVPPQSRARAIPVSVSVPQELPEIPRGKLWQLRDEQESLDAQVVGTEGRDLVFLLPVRSSEHPTTRKLELVQAPALSRPTMTMEESEGRSIHLYESGSRILSYNSGMMLKPEVPEDRRRSSYVHPIFAPDGTELTDDFPADHLHHRGLSWMWPHVEIGGVDYNLWDIRGIRQRFEAWVERTAGPVCSSLVVSNGWYVGDRRVASERAALLAYRGTPEGRALDIVLTFEALERPIRLTGETGPERKGYGGLCLRFAPRADTVMTTNHGVQEKDSNLLPFPWADLNGRFGSTGKIAGAAVFVDARNPGFPNGWTLRNYGFLGVAWPGVQTYTLEPGAPVTLRYRLWLHSGRQDKDVLEAQYQAYARPPQARVLAD